MNDKVEIIRSNKGGMKLIHKGYMYTVHKKRQSGGIRWRCTQRSLHCKGSISTGNGFTRINMPHNHVPDPHSVALARCRQMEEFADISSFVETECEDLMDDESCNLRSGRIRVCHGDVVGQWLLDNDADSLPLSQRLSYQLTPDPLALDGESDKELPQMGSNSQPPNLNVSGSGNGVASSIGSMSGSEAAPASKQENSEEPQVDEVCLRWNSHHSNMKTSLPTLLGREQYVDCTLVAEGKSLKCHRVIISSCSIYFDEILQDITPFQHPVIFLKGIPFWILKSLIDFMYAGEVHIDQTKLQDLLEVAENLKIKGLAGKSTAEHDAKQNTLRNSEPQSKLNPQPKSATISGKRSSDSLTRSDPPPKTQKTDHVTKQATKSEPQLKPNKDPVTKTKQEGSTLKVKQESLLRPIKIETIKPKPESIVKQSKVDILQKNIKTDSKTDTENLIEEENLRSKDSRKSITKKVKKKRCPEHEMSPPPFMLRKGTKSRPHVKIPKHYSHDFESPDLKPEKDIVTGQDFQIKNEPNEETDEEIAYSSFFVSANETTSAVDPDITAKESNENLNILETLQLKHRKRSQSNEEKDCVKIEVELDENAGEESEDKTRRGARISILKPAQIISKMESMSGMEVTPIKTCESD